MPSDIRKNFVFSSKERFELLDGLLKDFAFGNKRTESSTIELALEKFLMPTNPTAAHWVEQLYAENITLAEAYKRICITFSNPMEHDTFRNADAKPLLDMLAHAFAQDCNFFIGDHKEMKYIQRDLGMLQTAIQHPQDNALCEEYIQLLENEPTEIGPLFIVNLLSRNWNDLRLKHETYDILVRLIEISPEAISNTAKDRYKYVEIVKALFGDE